MMINDVRTWASCSKREQTCCSRSLDSCSAGELSEHVFRCLHCERAHLQRTSPHVNMHKKPQRVTVSFLKCEMSTQSCRYQESGIRFGLDRCITAPTSSAGMYQLVYVWMPGGAAMASSHLLVFFKKKSIWHFVQSELHPTESEACVFGSKARSQRKKINLVRI